MWQLPIGVQRSGRHPGGLINVDLLRSFPGIFRHQEVESVSPLHTSATSLLSVLKSRGEGLRLGVGLRHCDSVSILSVTGPQTEGVFISHPINPKRNQTLHLWLSSETQIQDTKLAKHLFHVKDFWWPFPRLFQCPAHCRCCHLGVPSRWKMSCISPQTCAATWQGNTAAPAVNRSQVFISLLFYALCSVSGFWAFRGFPWLFSRLEMPSGLLQASDADSL